MIWPFKKKGKELVYEIKYPRPAKDCLNDMDRIKPKQRNWVHTDALELSKSDIPRVEEILELLKEGNGLVTPIRSLKMKGWNEEWELSDCWDGKREKEDATDSRLLSDEDRLVKGYRFMHKIHDDGFGNTVYGVYEIESREKVKDFNTWNLKKYWSYTCEFIEVFGEGSIFDCNNYTRTHSLKANEIGNELEGYQTEIEQEQIKFEKKKKEIVELKQQVIEEKKKELIEAADQLTQRTQRIPEQSVSWEFKSEKKKKANYSKFCKKCGGGMYKTKGKYPVSGKCCYCRYEDSRKKKK